MKTLCPKPGSRGGGKIHPSPAEDPIRAAFRLLPAAILVLVAGLGPEDREVLAYLVTLPVELAKDAAAAAPARGGGGGRGGSSGRRRVVGHTPPAVWFVGHPPTHGCGCFECYISFWARWNRSPERDRIHDAVQAFEEHLAAAAAAEASATPPSSSRRRARRGRLQGTPPPPPLPMPLRRPKSPAPKVVEVVQATVSPLTLASPPPQPPQAPAASTAAEEEDEKVVVPEPAAAAAEPEECCEVAAEASEEERKRGWASVMGGVLGLRLWGLWSPAVESAT